jgi:GAF domain-containing protein/anti-sigma regulatory factor (Ser/Thr protein kinase)
LVATAAYQPEPVAAAAARRFVRETLRSWPLTGRPARQETLIDDAVLLTSELVTNAVVHAGTCVHVTCKLSGGTLEIVVLDERPAQIIPDRPRAPADPAERTSGRGLQLPSELASAWGVTYARAAKAVWFRLSLPGRAAGGRNDAPSGGGPGEAAIRFDDSMSLAGPDGAGRHSVGRRNVGRHSAGATGWASDGAGPGAGGSGDGSSSSKRSGGSGLGADGAGSEGAGRHTTGLRSVDLRSAGLHPGSARLRWSGAGLDPGCAGLHPGSARLHRGSAGLDPGCAGVDCAGLRSVDPDSARMGDATSDVARTDGARTDGARTDGARTDGARTDGARTDGFLAATPVPAPEVPVWARRNLSRLDYEELLSRTAEVGRAAVAADIAYLLDAGEDGELRVRAVAGVGQPWLAPGSVTWSAARALAGAALSLVTVPLIVDGRVTGMLAVAAAEPGRFGEHHAAQLQELADRTAPALERARLGELEQGWQDRAAFLAAAGEELSSTLDEEKIAAIGTRTGAGSIASWCAILVADAAGRMRLLNAAHADATRIQALEWLLRHVDPPTGEAAERRASRMAGWQWQLEPAAQAGQGQEPGTGQEPRQVEPGPVEPPSGLSELTADQAWCFPLEAPDRTFGLLAIGGPGEHWPAREARELAAGLARRIAVALDNARRHASRQANATVRLPSGEVSAD